MSLTLETKIIDIVTPDRQENVHFPNLRCLLQDGDGPEKNWMKLMDALVDKNLLAVGTLTHAAIEKLATDKGTDPGMMLLGGWAAQQSQSNVEQLATILTECGIDCSCLGGTIKKEAVEVLYGSGTSCVTVKLQIFDVVLFLVLSVVSGFTEKKKRHLL